MEIELDSISMDNTNLWIQPSNDHTSSTAHKANQLFLKTEAGAEVEIEIKFGGKKVEYAGKAKVYVNDKKGNQVSATAKRDSEGNSTVSAKASTKKK